MVYDSNSWPTRKLQPGQTFVQNSQEFQSLLTRTNIDFQTLETDWSLFAILSDMKHVNKPSAIILGAIIVGFLLASIGTKVTYSCLPSGDDKGCVSFEKAIMHPFDLFHNRQGSLTDFFSLFVISSLVTIALAVSADIVKKRTNKD